MNTAKAEENDGEVVVENPEDEQVTIKQPPADDMETDKEEEMDEENGIKKEKEPFSFHDSWMLWELADQYRDWMQPGKKNWQTIADDYNKVSKNKPKRTVDELRNQYQFLEKEYDTEKFGTYDDFHMKVSRLNYYNIKKNYLEEKMRRELTFLEDRNRMFSMYMKERLKLEKREFALRRNLLLERHKLKMLKLQREHARYKIVACDMVIEVDKEEYDQLTFNPKSGRRAGSDPDSTSSLIKVKKYRVQGFQD